VTDEATDGAISYSTGDLEALLSEHPDLQSASIAFPPQLPESKEAGSKSSSSPHTPMTSPTAATSDTIEMLSHVKKLLQDKNIAIFDLESEDTLVPVKMEEVAEIPNYVPKVTEPNFQMQIVSPQFCLASLTGRRSNRRGKFVDTDSI
jgi:hypothetical protein